jgi:hypothetical protein
MIHEYWRMIHEYWIGKDVEGRGHFVCARARVCVCVCEGPRSRCYRRTAALRLIVQSRDEDDEDDEDD